MTAVGSCRWCNFEGDVFIFIIQIMESTQNKIYEIEEANEQAVPRMRLEDD